MRLLKPLGYTFVALGILLGALSLAGVVDLPSTVILLPALGAIVVLGAEIRSRRARR